MNITPKKNLQLAETMSFIVRKDLQNYFDGKRNENREREYYNKTGVGKYQKYSKFLTERNVIILY